MQEELKFAYGDLASKGTYKKLIVKLKEHPDMKPEERDQIMEELHAVGNNPRDDAKKVSEKNLCS